MIHSGVSGHHVGRQRSFLPTNSARAIPRFGVVISHFGSLKQLLGNDHSRSTRGGKSQTFRFGRDRFRDANFERL